MALGYLRSTGIEVLPVIISTRNHGRVTESFPFSDLFNNILILATIDGKQKLLDATDAFCPNSMIPANYCNGKGYIVTDDAEKWILIKNEIQSTNITTVKYTLNLETNSLEGDGIIRSTGHFSIKERKKHAKDAEKLKNELEEHGLTLKENIKIKDETTKSKVFQYGFNFKSDITNIEDQLIFSPFMQLPIQTNPFKQEKRDLAIDLIYPTSKSYQAEFEIPSGYRIEQLPDGFTQNNTNCILRSC